MLRPNYSKGLEPGTVVRGVSGEAGLPAKQVLGTVARTPLGVDGLSICDG